MNTCKTCKWWEGEIGGSCKCKDIRVAEKDDDNSYETMPELNQLLASTDGEECVILTGEDFACIHHKTKGQ